MESSENNGMSENTPHIGGIIVGIMAGIAAIINIVVLLTVSFETIQPQIFLGVMLALMVAIGIILLGFWWKKPPPKVVGVTNIAASVGTACTPNNSLRTAKQAGTPPTGPWVLVSTWVEKTPGTKLIPSTKLLGYAFGEETQTSFFTCQDQKCIAGKWANVGKPKACNTQATRKLQFDVGGTKWLPWTQKDIDASHATGSFTVV